LDWFRTHIHQYGRLYDAGTLLHRITGQSLQAGPWLAYIRNKFGALYDGVNT
jgi:carboxypeptidase Taq